MPTWPGYLLFFTIKQKVIPTCQAMASTICSAPWTPYQLFLLLYCLNKPVWGIIIYKLQKLHILTFKSLRIVIIIVILTRRQVSMKGHIQWTEVSQSFSGVWEGKKLYPPAIFQIVWLIPQIINSLIWPQGFNLP